LSIFVSSGTQRFEKCRQLLPENGWMLLHCIVLSSPATLRRLQIEITPEDVAFAKFIRARSSRVDNSVSPSEFRISPAKQASIWNMWNRCGHTTPARWIAGRAIWKAASERAIAMTSNEVYDRYMKYLTGCADFFRKGNIDVMQFQLRCA
jgi:cyclopropane-fatty-acyl-phospholipid synthase